MARGGYGTGSGVPLRDRVRAGGPDARPTPAEAAAGPAAPAGADGARIPARHCWVTVPVDGPVPRPGLLLEWRQVERGRWEGRVVYAAGLRPQRWALVEEWVPAELLSPP